jgi:hypothetical protein
MAYCDQIHALLIPLLLPTKHTTRDDKIFVTLEDLKRSDHPYVCIRVYYSDGDPYNYKGSDKLVMKNPKNQIVEPIESPKIFSNPDYNTRLSQSSPYKVDIPFFALNKKRPYGLFFNGIQVWEYGEYCLPGAFMDNISEDAAQARLKDIKVCFLSM